MTKEALRKIYRDKRNALSESELFQISRQLSDWFFISVDLSFIKIVHVYLPIESKKEPDTWLIVERIRREFPHIRLSVPKVVGEGMENIFFEGLHQLEKTRWGISEPRQGLPTPSKKIDLVIVPLLAFDTLGHRVGYGKGFYDRFLKECRPDCQKVGLSLFEPEQEPIESNEYDIPLNSCLTPSSHYLFQTSGSC
ncbi:MAG: 5-formyltetrahydrofolate cyclo-ligase [Cyclobacteriaceae bacterium]|nr:5-formyltetrahydrofolate cyclo-ligase [Cyclobacteriaceae bacterium]